MQALRCNEFGNLDNLTIEEVSLPEIHDDEVVINVVACGVNFPDLLILENKYQFKPDLPFTPGGEVTGVVSRIGKNVKNFYLGQRVFAIDRWGGLAEKMIVHKDRLTKLPDEIDLLSAAGIMYNMSTAFYALKNRGRAKSGESILILGAAGGVGLAAVQLARAMGLKVIAAASSKEKLDLCEQFGGDYFINYKDENIKERVNEITSNTGVNLVLDTVGGSNAELAVRSLAWGGRYLVVGFAAGEIPKIPLNLLLLKGAEIKGVFWGKFSREEPLKQRENVEEILEYFVTGKVKPYITKQYSLDLAAEALKDFKDRKISGKAVVVCNPGLLEKDNKQVRPKERREKFVFVSKEHVLESVGVELGESRWFQVTQEVINDFADATLDHQWIHIRPDLVKGTPVGSTIAHGFLTLSLSPKFLTEIYEMPFVKMGINYGVDRLRFLQPIKVGSEIQMTAKLLSAEMVKNDGIKMRMEATYFVKGLEKPVCSVELLSVVY